MCTLTEVISGITRVVAKLHVERPRNRVRFLHLSFISSSASRAGVWPTKPAVQRVPVTSRVQFGRGVKLTTYLYRGADKSLAGPGRKQATATEEFEFHISYL